METGPDVKQEEKIRVRVGEEPVCGIGLFLAFGWAYAGILE